MNVTGQGHEDREGAGEDDPGAGDDRAGGGERAQRALARPVRSRLLAHARHQEDRVVDPERDEEDEGEGGDRGVHARVADHILDEEDAEAEGAEEAQDHARDQHERRDERPQQDREDDRDHQESDRHDQLQVGLDRLRRSRTGPPSRRPTSAVRPGPRSSTADRIAGTASNASGVNGSPSRIDVDRPDRAVGRDVGSRRRGCDLVDPLDGARRRLEVRRARSRRRRVGRRSWSARECRPGTPPPSARSLRPSRRPS